MASLSGILEAVLVLQQAGADLSQKGRDDGSVLGAAHQGGKENVIQILLDAGADMIGEVLAGVWSEPRPDADRAEYHV
jgi:hypothetical protein